MFGRRWIFGGPRRRSHWAVLPAVLVLFCLVYGFEEMSRERQTNAAWQGSIVRAYSGSGFLSTKRRHRPRYWEVRTAEGSVQSVQIYEQGLWGTGRPGDWVVKSAGYLHPVVVRHR